MQGHLAVYFVGGGAYLHACLALNKIEWQFFVDLARSVVPVKLVRTSQQQGAHELMTI